MTYAALVAELYARLGTWQAVADACGGLHSPGYYQQVARGRIQKPSEATLAGIVAATESPERLLKCDFSKDTRKTVHLSDDDHAAGNLERERLGLTWPEMVAKWREDAAALLELDAGGKLRERR